MDTRWRIELFGGVRALRGETIVDHFRTQKTAALLGLLAYPPGRNRSRDELIEAFWPDDDLTTARHKLSVALHALRQQLEPDGVAEGAVLAADRFSVRLARDAVTTDVGEFDEAVARAASSPADRDRVLHLSRAVSLYRGPLLAGFYDAWIFPEQQRLAERFVEALGQLTALHEAAGDRATALQAALQAVAADPLREDVHYEVMRLQLAAGHPAKALRQFSELERRLREELDASPAAAARELARAARAAMETETGSDRISAGGARAKPAAASTPPDAEAPGGAVPLDSPFYVERETDRRFRTAVARRDSIVLVKGPRQVGKTSLLARGLQQARESGAAVVFTDLQTLNEDHLSGADALLRALAEDLCEQLDLSVSPAEVWAPRRGPSPNFRRYLRGEVLGALEQPLVWGLDEVDRLFSCPFHTEVFGLFRSWHNERALNPTGPLSRLTLAIAYATEAHLFILDLNQSPFNVGTRLRLSDFELGDVGDLNRRYGSPLRSDEEVRRFFELVGGHPYLTRCGLHGMAAGASLQQVEAGAEQDEGLFSDHLRRILLLLQRRPSLCETVREVLRGQPCRSLEDFYHLRSAGVLTGDAVDQARPRSLLYARYLSRHLL
jgi:DNA-binding SARP family transcriptional activator